METPSQKTDPDERIARLVRTIREAEEELQALTGGQLDAVVSEGHAPYLLRDAQAKLRVSEAAQRALAETQIGILNALPAHLALLDSNGVILVVNEAWRRFASANVLQSTDFFVGQNYLGVCESAHGECADEALPVAAGIRKVLSGELKDFAIEYPCHSPTEKRWFRLMVTPLSDAPGAGAVVMHINVTERRQAEEVLRQKEREQRRLAEELTIETRRLHESQAAANVGSWETDLASLEVSWTEETFRIFETGPDQFTPTHQGFLERVHPEDRQRVDDAFRDSIGKDKRGPFAIEHRLLFPEGRIKHVEERWQTFNDETGGPVRAVGTCQDITQRKVADELVRTRARQQETIARIGFEATRTTTLQGIFDFATGAIAGALGVEYCKVLQIAPDGSHLRLVSGVGWQPGLIGVATVGVDRESQAGFTLKSDGAIYVNDFAKETRFAAPPLLRDHEVVSGLSVKIMLRDKPWGVLGAHCRTARNFTDADADFMQAVATLLSVVIERLAVQRTLTRSEARMRDAQRIAHLGNWELDIAENKLSWSDEVFRIFGVEPSAFAATYESFFAFVHPEDREAMRAARQVALSGGGLLEIEHRIIRPDGSIRHVRERGELIHDESGRPVALAGTVLDTTDLRAAQSRVERMNALLTEAQRIAHLGSWDMDVTSGTLVWSEETCRLFGIRPEEFGGTFEAFTAFILPEDQAPYAAVHAGITPEVPLLEAEYRIRRPDGEVCWMFERGRVTFDAAGKVIRRLGVVMDVTERKRAEEALRESEAHLKFTLESSQLGDWELDLATGAARCSLRHDRCFGYSEPIAEWGFDKFIAHVHPDDRDRVERHFRACVKANTSWDFECRVIWPDGSTHWIAAQGNVFFADGQARRMHGIVRDVTERKRAEEELRESEERFRLMIEGSEQVLFYTHDREHRFNYLSPSTRDVLGYDPEELVGQPCDLLVIADDPMNVDVHALTDQALQDGKPCPPYPAVVRHKDGRRIVLEILESPILSDGQVIGIQGFARDITEREKAVEQLRQNEQLLRIAGQIAHMGAWSVDFPEARITWSEEVCAIHDMPAGTVPALDQALDFYTPESRPVIESAFSLCASEGTPFDVELELLSANGQRKWVRSIGQAERDKTGAIRRVHGAIQDITEQKKAEEEARTSAEKLSQTLESITDGFFTLDRDWRFTYINAEAEKLLSRSRSNLLGHSVWETHPEAVGSTFEREYRKAVATQTTVAFEEFYPPLENWFEVKVYPTAEGLAVYFRDVTERRRLSEALRASESKFRRLAESNILGIMFWDARGNISDPNDAFLRIIGYTREEFNSGQINWRSMTPPEYRTRDEQALAEVAATGSCTPFEKEFFHKEGRRVTVMVGAAALEGAKDHGICFVVDISEQKQAMAALRVSEERFRLLAKATNDAIWDWNLTTNELWWNEGYEILFGYAREEIDPTLKQWSDRIHPEDRARVTDSLHRVIDHGGEGWSDEYRFRRKDGRYTHVLDRGHVIRDAAGKPVRMIGGMTDLTKQKEHEIALSKSNRALQLLSRCNEALIRSETESELLETICQIAVDVGGFRLAWVGYALDDADKTIVCESHAGLEDGYLSHLQVTWADNDPLGNCPAGKVIRHGEPVVIPDLETDEGFRPWLEAAKARGFKGVIALPLADEKRIFGVLVLYLTEVRQPLRDEMRLLRELADDMAFGIIAIRTRLDRLRLHTAVAKVAASVSAAASTDFFEQLIRNMVTALGAKAGFVAKVLPGEPVTSRTIAVVVDDQVSANFDYILQGTPCENFFTADTCIIQRQAAREFPLSPTLAALAAEGFVGRRLDNASGAFIGQLVVIFSEPLQDADFVVSTLQIFAARAAAELERQETDTRLREQAALLDKAQDAILVRDLDHHITYWNNSAARLYGWTAEEAVGRSERELLYYDLDIFDQSVEKLITEGEWTGEFKQKRNDGRIIDIEGRWTLLRDAAGQPKTVLAIHTDVTERKQQEKLAQRSQRMESIGTLAGGIAHDLNNALAPIMMSGELLRMQYPGQSELLDMIESSSKRAADMVRQLLTFAKGAEGERVSVHPGELVKELEKIIQGSFPKNIRLMVKCDPKLPLVRGDSTQLHQVLLNLCVNARDAMPNGGTLTLEAESRDVDAVYASSIPDAMPGKYLALRVRDTGTGIPPETLDRIFDPFFTTKGPDKGTGLGLSTVMGIIKGHGGFLQVHSQRGEGSAFTAYLPVEGAGSDTEQVTRAAVEFRGQGETLLLVDDEAAIRGMARTVLQRLNFKPLTATDGTDGLMQAALHRTELSAVITDLHMPHMDGLAFVRVLRQMLPDIPVVVASGRMEDAVAEEFKTLGVTARLDKPFTEAQLMEALRNLLAPK